MKQAGIQKDYILDGKIVQSDKFDLYRFIKLNLENKLALDNLFKNEQFDYVVNLAAQAGVRYSIDNPYAYIDSNILGFINILEAWKQQSKTFNLCI